MRFWTKSRLIFNAFRDNAKASMRQVAVQTGRSKSSVHRLGQARARRDRHPESWLWDTAEGRRWCLRLVVAVLYLFGLKRGVGAETLSEGFARLHLEQPVGCSPSAWRGMMEALERVILDTAKAWEGEGGAGGETRPSIGAVEETFVERLMVGCMALVRGYLVVEEIADDRPSEPWSTRAEARLEAVGVRGLSLRSDRAKALVQRADTGLDCLSMPDVLHLIHALVKRSALALGRRLHQARRDLEQAQEHLRTCLVSPSRAPPLPQAQARVEACGAEVTRWESVRLTSRRHLERVSLIVPPWRLVNSTRQSAHDGAQQ